MPKSDRICHVETGDRPFYNFQHGIAFVYYLSTILGLVIGIGGYLALLGITRVQFMPFYLQFFIIIASGTIGGFIVANILFFLYRAGALKAGLFTAFIAACEFTGISAMANFTVFTGIAPLLLVLGLPIAAIPWIALVVLYRAYGKIGVFTDGVKIGELVLRYDDIEKAGFGTGPVEKSIPEADREKPLDILTPIDLDYEGKDFIIHHVYLIVVTAEKVYVAQSLNRQSNLAQDVRNAWVVYLSSKGIKTKRNIYFEEKL